MNNPKEIARITRWIQQEGRLEQFRLTLEVEATMSERGEKGKDDLLPVAMKLTVSAHKCFLLYKY